MFTGIIEELAKISKINNINSGMEFCISAKKVMKDLKSGDSVSINGVCLTVKSINKHSFFVDLVPETLEKSNLGELIEEDYVNIERALKLSDRLSGHILQGHVETLGVILEKEIKGEGGSIMIGLDPEWMKYCIPKGSIALDGISLTIAKIESNMIEIAVVPYTLENTTLGLKNKSDTVNIETDILGRYVENLLDFNADSVDLDLGILKAIRQIQYGES